MIKYVMDKDTGFIKVNDKGLPLVMDDEKEGESPFGLDGLGLYAKIPTLQNEAKERRVELKKVKDGLKKYDDLGIDDLDGFESWRADATKALDTVKNLDDKKLIDANKVEEIKQAIKDEAAVELSRFKKQHKDLILEKDTSLNNMSGQVRGLVVDNKFHSSKYITDDLIVTPAMARKLFGENFKVEVVDGKSKAVGYLGNDPIMSRSNIGEFAPFDEALKHMIDKDPERDSYIKAEARKTADKAGERQFQTPGQGDARTSTEKIRAGLEKMRK